MVASNSTVYVDFNPNTPIKAAWLNDVNTAVYATLPGLAGTIGGLQTSITAIQAAVTMLTQQLATGSLTYSMAGGTVNVITATLANSPVTTLTDGQPITLKSMGQNTLAAVTLELTLAMTAQMQAPIVKGNNMPLTPGDTGIAGYAMKLTWNATFAAFVLHNPATGIGEAQTQIKPFTAAVMAGTLVGTLGPCTTAFRNASAALGGSLDATNLAPLTLAVPAGATLGMTAAVSARLVWLVAYNLGVPVLCVVNPTTGLNLDETGFISPTIISATSIMANVVYSASAVTPGSPYRIVGFTDITEAAAGTWATGPMLVQPAGGVAMRTLPAYSRMWSAELLNNGRTGGVTYYNTTGQDIEVLICSNTGYNTYLYVNGVIIATNSVGSTGNSLPITATIPPGASYMASNGYLWSWFELR